MAKVAKGRRAAVLVLCGEMFLVGAVAGGGAVALLAPRPALMRAAEQAMEEAFNMGMENGFRLGVYLTQRQYEGAQE